MIGKKKYNQRDTEWQKKAFEKKSMVNALNDQVVELMSIKKQHEGIIARYWKNQACINNSNNKSQKVRVKVNKIGEDRWEVWVVLLC